MKSYSIESLQQNILYYPRVQDLLDSRFIVLDLISGKERELKHIKSNPNKIVDFNANCRKPSIVQELFTVATIIAYDIEERRIVEGFVYLDKDNTKVTTIQWHEESPLVTAAYDIEWCVLCQTNFSPFGTCTTEDQWL